MTPSNLCRQAITRIALNSRLANWGVLILQDVNDFYPGIPVYRYFWNIPALPRWQWLLDTAIQVSDLRSTSADIMHSSTTMAFLSMRLFLTSCIIGANGQWQVDYLLSHEMLSFGDTKFNSSITFSLSRGGSVLTNYSTNWIHWPTPTIPKQWIKCEDPILRFRIATFNDASNFTIEVVELEPVVS